MEDDLKIFKVEYLSNHYSNPPQNLNLSLGDQTKIKILERNTTLNGRGPPDIKSRISRQPLIGSASNIYLKLRGQKRRPQNVKS